MSKHTPEPWHAGHLHDDKHPCNCRYVFGNDGRMGAVASVHVSADDGSDDPPLVEAMANQIRIVQCVNAMAGVSDPEAFVKSHGALVKAMDRIAFEPIGSAEATYEEIVHGMTAIARTAIANARKVKPQ